MSAPWAGRRLHFVGVGGAGMSGYARAAHELGASISGSDRAQSPYSERLGLDGVLEASIGHDARNLPEGDGVELVYSSAIGPENPERVQARERGIPEHPRAQLLAELSSLKRTVAVAGTHGKTTSASMLVHSLRAAGFDPAWLIGGSIGKSLPNARWSEGEWLVLEADESDRSMLSLQVQVALLTNVELDHHAAFGSLAEVREAFRLFLARAGAGVVLWDRPELLELLPDAGDGRVPVVAYDLPELSLRADGSRFQWRGLEVRLAVPGAHNVLNALGALETALMLGADGAQAVAGLADFAGAGRRFQRLGSSRGGALVVDDYAHHPTEVSATLSAARTLEPRRLIALFQPHLYSRTALLGRELGRALARADVIVVLEIYPARERAEDHPGVSGLAVAQAAADAAGGRPVYWLPSFEDARLVVDGILQAGDLCVVMGAGDVDGLARALVVG
jgi:UDP-N-acetylmuramate--alanine ligase